MNEYTVKVGETVRLWSRWFSNLEIVFAGQPSDQSYSVVVSKTSNHNSLAYNLYLPLNRRVIELPRGRLDIVRVTADELRFRYTK